MIKNLFYLMEDQRVSSHLALNFKWFLHQI